MPFAAVAVANSINIPCMRSEELSSGIEVTNEDGRKWGKSVRTARVAIAQVTFSRVLMASPSMGQSIQYVFLFYHTFFIYRNVRY